MKLSFVAAKTAEARKARDLLKKRYGHVAPQKADVIVALGGDGFIVQFGLKGQIGNYINNGKPHVKFPTEPEAAAAGLAELTKQLK